MSVCARMVAGISAIALLVGLALTPAAVAQDAMQMDIMFKESLTRGRDAERPRDDERRHVWERGDKPRHHAQLRQAERR